MKARDEETEDLSGRFSAGCHHLWCRVFVFPEYEICRDRRDGWRTLSGVCIME